MMYRETRSHGDTSSVSLLVACIGTDRGNPLRGISFELFKTTGRKYAVPRLPKSPILW